MAVVYTYQAQDSIDEKFVGSIGITPMSLVVIPVPQAQVTFAQPLSAADKTNMDQFFADRGFTFLSEMVV